MRLLQAKQMTPLPPQADSYSNIELVLLALFVALVLEVLITGHTTVMLIEGLIRLRAAVLAAWEGLGAGLRVAWKVYPRCERKVRNEHGNHKYGTKAAKNGKPNCVETALQVERG